MNEYTELATQILKKHGYPEARYRAAKDRDQSSWGTFSHAYMNQVCKEIERLHTEMPDELHNSTGD